MANDFPGVVYNHTCNKMQHCVGADVCRSTQHCCGHDVKCFSMPYLCLKLLNLLVDVVSHLGLCSLLGVVFLRCLQTLFAEGLDLHLLLAHLKTLPHEHDLVWTFLTKFLAEMLLAAFDHDAFDHYLEALHLSLY